MGSALGNVLRSEGVFSTWQQGAGPVRVRGQTKAVQVSCESCVAQVEVGRPREVTPRSLTRELSKAVRQAVEMRRLFVE